MDEGSLIVDVTYKVERVVRAPTDHPDAGRELEAFLEGEIDIQGDHSKW